MAASASRNSGSAASARNAGTASRRISRSWVRGMAPTVVGPTPGRKGQDPACGPHRAGLDHLWVFGGLINNFSSRLVAERPARRGGPDAGEGPDQFSVHTLWSASRRSEAVSARHRGGRPQAAPQPVHSGARVVHHHSRVIPSPCGQRAVGRGREHVGSAAVVRPCQGPCQGSRLASRAGQHTTPAGTVGPSPAAAGGGRVSVTDYDHAGAPPPYEEWGDGPAAYAPGEAPQHSGGGRIPPQDEAAEQSVLGAMMLSKDAIADCAESVRGVDFYRPGPRADPRRDHRPLRPGRAGRPGHRRGRAAAPGRARPGRRRPLPPHPLGQRADRGQRRLLRRDRPREGDPAPARRRRHPDRADRLRRRGPGRRRRRRGAGRGLQGHRPPDVRGLRAALATSWTASSTRSRRSATARPASTASRPASPTSTTSPTASTPAR